MTRYNNYYYSSAHAYYKCGSYKPSAQKSLCARWCESSMGSAGVVCVCVCVALYSAGNYSQHIQKVLLLLFFCRSRLYVKVPYWYQSIIYNYKRLVYKLYYEETVSHRNFIAIRIAYFPFYLFIFYN